MKLDAILRTSPVIPVIVIEDAAVAVPLAQALVRGGLRVLEVTLRTPAALAAMKAMAAVEGAIVGAGTVLSAAQYDDAIAAGAQFVVSPGLTDKLAEAAAARPVPLLPGTVTASEVMRAREAGLRQLKFFPAEPAGGVPVLKSFGAVFPDVSFCPTGGITLATASSYLKLPNIACVGGSWLTPPELLKAKDWAQVEALAAEAARLERKASN
jgi:2-dehydro-3-deoxyphosphogluconate aldolase / (4S)-4-hydroxy-2-oxoglutarate aldolase